MDFGHLSRRTLTSDLLIIVMMEGEVLEELCFMQEPATLKDAHKAWGGKGILALGVPAAQFRAFHSAVTS